RIAVAECVPDLPGRQHGPARPQRLAGGDSSARPDFLHQRGRPRQHGKRVPHAGVEPIADHVRGDCIVFGRRRPIRWRELVLLQHVQEGAVAERQKPPAHVLGAHLKAKEPQEWMPVHRPVPIPFRLRRPGRHDGAVRAEDGERPGRLVLPHDDVLADAGQGPRLPKLTGPIPGRPSVATRRPWESNTRTTLSRSSRTAKPPPPRPSTSATVPNHSSSPCPTTRSCSILIALDAPAATAFSVWESSKIRTPAESRVAAASSTGGSPDHAPHPRSPRVK